MKGRTLTNYFGQDSLTPKVTKVEEMTKRRIQHLVFLPEEYDYLREQLKQDKVLVAWNENHTIKEISFEIDAENELNNTNIVLDGN